MQSFESPASGMPQEISPHRQHGVVAWLGEQARRLFGRADHGALPGEGLTEQPAPTPTQPPPAEASPPASSEDAKQTPAQKQRTGRTAYQQDVYDILGGMYLYPIFIGGRRHGPLLEQSRRTVEYHRLDEITTGAASHWHVLDSRLSKGREPLDPDLACVVRAAGEPNIAADVIHTTSAVPQPRLGLEIGGHGALFTEFPEGHFSESRGIALSDGRNPAVLPQHEQAHHSVIEVRDIFTDLANGGNAAMTAWLNGREIAYVHERMEGGLTQQIKDPYRFFAGFNTLYKLVAANGLMHIQLPDVVVPLMRSWVAKNHQQYGDALAITFGKCPPTGLVDKQRWVMRLQKSPGAPQELSPLTPREVRTAYNRAEGSTNILYDCMDGMCTRPPALDSMYTRDVAAEALACLQYAQCVETDTSTTESTAPSITQSITLATPGGGWTAVHATQRQNEMQRSDTTQGSVRIHWINPSSKVEGILLYQSGSECNFTATFRHLDTQDSNAMSAAITRLASPTCMPKDVDDMEPITLDIHDAYIPDLYRLLLDGVPVNSLIRTS